jgi:hypothetical protein
MDTLFVVPTNRLRQLWGGQRHDALMSRLQTFVTDQPGGVVAGILPVDAAFDDGDANRCSPARQMTSPPDRRIDRHGAGDQPDVATPGADRRRHGIAVLPSPDGTATANESNYAEGFADNNRLVGSLARGYIQTDDPYATARGISLSGRELFVPELAVGRLVETKDDIVKALTHSRSTRASSTRQPRVRHSSPATTS